jgi:hypothetical protein
MTTLQCMLLPELDWLEAMTAMGHEGPFQARTLSARVAPIADLRAIATQREGSPRRVPAGSEPLMIAEKEFRLLVAAITLAVAQPARNLAPGIGRAQRL